MTRCAVLGATGIIGQRFVERLAAHPVFRLAAVAAGDRNVGRQYGGVPWRLPGLVPDAAADLVLSGPEDIPGPDEVPVVFSALPGGIAGPIERALAARGHRVFTNAADLRMEDDVPLLVPEVNPDHLALAEAQGDGYVVANGNCTAIVLTLALAPLHAVFGLEDVHVTSLQALSGAGHPGVSALDMAGNVLVHIPGEEEKLRIEPHKVLGRLDGARIQPARFPVHATCTRVPVAEGHLLSVHARLSSDADEDAVRAAWERFRGPAGVPELPSAPRRPVHVLDGDRPQPRLDAMAEGGMAVSVGRCRLDGARGVQFLALGSNTVRGAAGQSILNAEWSERRDAKA